MKVLAATAHGTPWYDDRDTLAELWRWLEDRGQQPDDPAYYLEKPWRWDVEYQDMRAEQRAAA